MKRIRARPLLMCVAFLLSNISVNLFPSIVYAVETNSNSYRTLNNIPFTGGSACSPSGSSTIASFSGSKNAELILRYFTEVRGMTLAQAAGFVGNMIQESGLEPRRIEGGATAPDNYSPVNGVGFGLVQWTFTPRQEPLVRLAEKLSENQTTAVRITDMAVQLEYVWQELNGAYKSTLKALASMPDKNDPVAAAIIIHGNTSRPPERANVTDPRFALAPTLGYEASGDSLSFVVETRGQKNAQNAYNSYRSSIQDGSGLSLDDLTVSTQTAAPVIANCVNSTTSCTPHTHIGDSKPEKLAAMFGKFEDESNWEPVNSFMDFKFKDNAGAVNGAMINKKVVPCLRAVENELRALEAAKPEGERYKVWGFTCSRLGEGRPDFYHGYAAACDINPSNGGPGNGCGFCGPPKWGLNNHDIPDEWVAVFEKYGWFWGGRWGGGTNGDWMHFQYEGDEADKNITKV